MTQSKAIWRSIAITLVASLAAACGSGPSESEFHAACMNEGRTGANKALSTSMGLERDAFCKCSAKAAHAGMPPEGYRLMVFEMQGKRQEVAALQAKMSDAEKMAVMKASFEVLGKCAGGG